MSTSLSEQLRRLAVPQTSALLDSRQRASILFDPKEAASKNRKTIYDLGYSGLQELIAINSSFRQFESTLFDESTLELERSVELSEVNKLIDKNISKFLHHLSPYFMLRPAHLCIEWLLRRFHLHQYNKREFLGLMLPYHETKIFVKCLQTIRIKKSDVEFNWLKPLQKPGVALPKTAILNRAASQPAFLAFICQTTQDAIKELGTRAHLLQAQINFYASVVVGALDAAPTIEEWHIVTILPSLLKALSSEVVDFVSAGFIVVSELVARTQIKHKLLNALIAKVVSVNFEQLRNAATLLLIWIFDTQSNMRPQFSRVTLLTLVQYKWLTGVISNLAAEGVAVHYLCGALISGSVQAIQSKDDDTELFKLFLDRLMYDVVLPNATAVEVINCFLDSYIAPHNAPVAVTKSRQKATNEDVIELDSDDDMGESAEDDFQLWYSNFLKKLERQYPTAFDETIKDALKTSGGEASHRSKAIKMALRYRLKSFDASSTDIYENLYHHTAKIRAYAIRSLIANLNYYQAKSQNCNVLKECLADRILDDSELVVAEVLQLPTKTFVDILGHSQFANALIGILSKTTDGDHERWSKVTLSVVQHLTAQDVVKNFDANLILLALMPFLFPAKSSKEVLKAINVILTSPIVEKVEFLKGLKKPGDRSESQFNTTEFKCHFLDVISHSQQTLKAVQFMESVQTQAENYLSQPVRFAHVLLLVTAFIKHSLSGAESLAMFKLVRDLSKPFKLKYMENQEWQQCNKQNCIPLQLFADFLSTLTRHTEFEGLNDWDQPSARLEFCLQILQLLSEEAFAHQQPQEKLEWSKMLKEFLDCVFQNPLEKLNFLLNFCIYEDLAVVGQNYIVLRLRAFALLHSLIGNKQNKIVATSEDVFKVMAALSSRHETLRKQAMKILKCMMDTVALEKSLQRFVEQVLERQQEISMDHEQFPLVLYTILDPSQKSDAKVGKLMLGQIMQVLKADKGGALKNVTFKVELLRMLKHVNDEQLMAVVLPLSMRALDEHKSSHLAASGVKLLEGSCSKIYQLSCERFNSQIIENVLVDNPAAWELFEKIFSSYDVYLMLEGRLTPVPCVLLAGMDELIFKNMPAKYQLGFIKLIVNCITVSGNDNISLAANKLLRRCSLDCRPLASILQDMCKKSLSNGVAKTRKSAGIAIKKQLPQLQTLVWREGEVLLELLENKKKLTHSESLVPALFDLLKLCLEVEEQCAVEYVKQLALSALLHCCQQAKLDGIDLHSTLPKTTFRIDQIVHCLRASPNPQTHHNALMLLSHCAALFPQQVLLNIVDIFTFMGSSVLRHDDAFSFHLINNIAESLLPIMVDTSSRSGESVVPILKVFSDIMLDVPEHRRLPLYKKFLQTLNAEQYMWMFLCVVFEQHVIEDEKQRLQQKKRSSGGRDAVDKMSARLKFAQILTSDFPPQIALQTCIELMHYVMHLPHSKEAIKATARAAPETVETNLFDVNLRTDKQLRHYKYVIMNFLSSFTCSEEFLQQIGSLSPEDLLLLKPYYQNFIIKTLSYVPVVNAAIEKSVESSQTKFWKVILHHLHDVLENAISLLSPDMFLDVIYGLMQHQLLSIRRKVIDLLINKLQQRDGYFDGCDDNRFKDLLKPLSDILGGIIQKEDSSNEINFLQQTAMIALKQLSKLYALKHIEEYKEILAGLIKMAKKRQQIPKVVFASAILTMVEITSNLKAHSLSHLPKLMPRLIGVLSDQAELLRQNPPDNVSLAIVTGIHKLLETMPLFLGPYLEEIIVFLTSISASVEKHQSDQAKDQRSALVLQKIDAVWAKIAAEVPPRILVPCSEKAYSIILSSKNYAGVGILMKLMLESITKTDIADLTAMQVELCGFFTTTIEFRAQLSGFKNLSLVGAIEAHVLDAFVAWILKLSESSFRPLYYRLYDWALKGEGSTEKILTFFLLTLKIVEALKSLFVLFAGEILQDVADLLNKYNSSKHEVAAELNFIGVELLRSILNTLYNIFLYDSKGFINAHRFEILMQPIVDQLQNSLVLENEELSKTLTSCIAQLAVAVSNDVMWKQLNQQVLLKTRTNVPEVRILSFSCCVEIARKLGDNFTTLLPETVPFIAELFEDENPRVERSTRKSVQELESILGESLQKYL